MRKFLFMSIFTICIIYAVLSCTEMIIKKLDKIESEISAVNSRMDSLEFFKLPEVKK